MRSSASRKQRGSFGSRFCGRPWAHRSSSAAFERSAEAFFFMDLLDVGKRWWLEQLQQSSAVMPTLPPFFHIRPADVMSKFYGDSQKRIAALEELAKERSPAIVFFDEVDTLLGRRDAAHGVAEHHKAVTNALLTWMDGFEQDADRVFFIGATNRADAIDEAALRRFGELVEVGLPDFEQRLALLKSLVSGATKDGHLSDLSDESLRDIAGRTEGMSGDDVSRVVQQAYMEVLRELPDGVHKDLKLEDVPPVTAAHFDHIMNTRVLSSTAMYQNLQKQGHHR
mmetsp:Transcript_14642/g.32301  ORF Transcript_14642/g.32301 Transcript_14642/m.32301 type:complete len:282 (+) Transcript_14642:1117-1962(+)